jgi:hypothetical protein
MVMKDKSQKSLKSFVRSQRGRVLITAAVTLSVFGGVGKAIAANDDLLKILGSVVTDVLVPFTEISKSFESIVQSFSDVPDPSKLVGKDGIYAPDLAKKVDSAMGNELFNVLNKGTSAQATTQQAGSRVLSEQGQKQTKENQKKIEDLNKETGKTADLLWDDAQKAQNFDSTQDVLKRMSYQLSGIADINAAQVRLSTLQNSNAQEMTTQLAALNLANSATLNLLRSQEQAKKVTESMDEQSQSAARYRILSTNWY